VCAAIRERYKRNNNKRYQHPAADEGCPADPGATTKTVESQYAAR
jgi:hypothetical protein